MTTPYLSWDQITLAKPRLAQTLQDYLAQVACVLRPRSVDNTDQTLRCFAQFLIEQRPDLQSVAEIGRQEIEDFKPWLMARPGRQGGVVQPMTLAHRLGLCECFSCALTNGDGTTHPNASPCSTGTSPNSTTPCPRPSMTRPQQSSCAPPKPNPASSSG